MFWRIWMLGWLGLWGWIGFDVSLFRLGVSHHLHLSIPLFAWWSWYGIAVGKRKSSWLLISWGMLGAFLGWWIHQSSSGWLPDWVVVMVPESSTSFQERMLEQWILAILPLLWVGFLWRIKPRPLLPCFYAGGAGAGTFLFECMSLPILLGVVVGGALSIFMHEAIRLKWLHIRSEAKGLFPKASVISSFPSSPSSHPKGIHHHSPHHALTMHHYPVVPVFFVWEETPPPPPGDSL
ncbi:hypothetical protein ACFYKX_11385 [Cytobacillus sp. FJAT-54145]|uniref:Uncharacterized protein n=1 Tax=Cytobacillus spartinae TaxID=3299023 RepID=A0ABW6KEG7_9BACI